VKSVAKYQSKTRIVKNKNKIFPKFLSPSIIKAYGIHSAKYDYFFGSKLHTRLIIEGDFFCPHGDNMKSEICNMKYPIITVLDRLSNIMINVYDFHIILYFHLGQIMQNKPNFQGCEIM
jgi:hypothetical protein